MNKEKRRIEKETEEEIRTERNERERGNKKPNEKGGANLN